MTSTVLILGASGKIGTNAARAFRAAGWSVRTYQRGTDMTASAAGADVIVNGLNPPAYHNWPVLIPQITKQVIAAAKASGATVIIPGNVYNFAAVPGTWDENTPQTPPTRKGKIRVEMEQSYRATGVRTIILRAGNFIAPGAPDDVMKMVILRAIKKGYITHAGRPDAMQAYAYLPDWARAAVLLADKRADLPGFADIPFPGHAFTITQLKATLAHETGRALRLRAFPWWLMRALSPFMEVARELQEMRYLWSLDHSLSDATFARLLPDFEATEMRIVMLSGLADDIHPDKAMRAGGLAVRA
jgi:nucleoside-diphosphate-sugar epimerase